MESRTLPTPSRIDEIGGSVSTGSSIPTSSWSAVNAARRSGSIPRDSARHGIKPVIESFAFVDANSASDRLRSGEFRYRAILTR